MNGDSIKLGDFGLAYLVESSSLMERPKVDGGTRFYMSPEKIEEIYKGEEKGYSFDEMAKSDVW